MSRANKECIVCKNMFHACGSCGLVGWENEICTNKCYKEYREQKREEYEEKFSNLFKDKQLCKDLFDAIEDPRDWDGYITNILSEMLEEVIKNDRKN
jgi:hypothetical protein